MTIDDPHSEKAAAAKPGTADDPIEIEEESPTRPMPEVALPGTSGSEPPVVRKLAPPPKPAASKPLNPFGLEAPSSPGVSMAMRSSPMIIVGGEPSQPMARSGAQVGLGRRLMRGSALESAPAGAPASAPLSLRSRASICARSSALGVRKAIRSVPLRPDAPGQRGRTDRRSGLVEASVRLRRVRVSSSPQRPGAEGRELAALAPRSACPSDTAPPRAVSAAAPLFLQLPPRRPRGSPRRLPPAPAAPPPPPRVLQRLRRASRQ